MLDNIFMSQQPSTSSKISSNQNNESSHELASGSTFDSKQPFMMNFGSDVGPAMSDSEHSNGTKINSHVSLPMREASTIGSTTSLEEDTSMSPQNSGGNPHVGSTSGRLTITQDQNNSALGSGQEGHEIKDESATQLVPQNSTSSGQLTAEQLKEISQQISACHAAGDEIVFHVPESGSLPAGLADNLQLSGLDSSGQYVIAYVEPGGGGEGQEES